eukprot:gb/GECH01006461.1/.p1 GENE.gb/GECH01006461.1/~~gb/GECH01006461.1/.p1  ORF type:complete len:172 (+),score=37.50 gb/GECH01006461.1/:1-516(+)
MLRCVNTPKTSSSLRRQSFFNSRKLSTQEHTKKQIPRHDIFGKYMPDIWTYENKQSKNILELDHTNFEDVVIESKQPMVLDMFCDDLVECNMLSKNIAPVIEELNGKVKLAAINSELHSGFLRDTIQKFPVFEITAFPVMFAINDGKVLDVAYGYKTQKEIAKWIKEHFDV